jgi:hypothetical protein
LRLAIQAIRIVCPNGCGNGNYNHGVAGRSENGHFGDSGEPDFHSPVLV